MLVDALDRFLGNFSDASIVALERAAILYLCRHTA